MHLLKATALVRGRAGAAVTLLVMLTLYNTTVSSSIHTVLDSLHNAHAVHTIIVQLLQVAIYIVFSPVFIHRSCKSLSIFAVALEVFMAVASLSLWPKRIAIFFRYLVVCILEETRLPQPEYRLFISPSRDSNSIPLKAHLR